MPSHEIEEKQLISRAGDIGYLADKQYTMKYMGFLSPAERVCVSKQFRPPAGIKAEFWGGYEDSERTLLLCYPEDFSREDFGELPLAVLKIEGRDLSSLSHRDYLGSLIGLGLKREKIGDILPNADCCYVLVLREILPYILLNLTKIGNTGVRVSETAPETISVPQKQTETIEGTVSALRLDSVLALALHTSRSKAVEWLRSGRVMLNWETAEDASKTIKEGDMLSVRGFGRVRLAAVNGRTRKERIHIRLEKFI